ncbi:MAG: hypothetical protein Q7W02_20220 [Candidatus Rokubacteria bacterium]|nr:hypothetical protein [Candidatus Rokubacteria bacterium]
MAKQGNILVGTIGQGVMMSADDGESWTRASVRQGMHSDCIVRALLPDPRRLDVVYAGTDMGLYESDDGGAHWRLLDTPMKGSMVWSMAIDPVDPNVMFVGTGTPSKPGIYRSTDAGKSWEQLAVDIAAECPNVGIPTAPPSFASTAPWLAPRGPARATAAAGGHSRGRRCGPR